jgi:hypothetical protein
MSIPLIQDNQKDSINASLIAIKREEERLQALIAEADKKIAQLNELKVSKSDIVDEVTLNNMQSVTSNAVAQEISNVDTSLNNLDTALRSLISGKLSGSKITYRGPQSVNITYENRMAIIYSSEYAGSAGCYIALSQYNTVGRLINLGTSSFSVSLSHVSNGTDKVTVSISSGYSWNIVLI